MDFQTFSYLANNLTNQGVLIDTHQQVNSIDSINEQSTPQQISKIVSTSLIEVINAELNKKAETEDSSRK